MKRLVAFLLSVLLMLSASVALAEGIDVTSMTDEELHAIVNAARNELAKRERVAAEDVVLFDQDGVTVYLTGKYTIEEWTDATTMLLEAIAVNDSSHDIDVVLEQCTINGWETNSATGIFDIGAGKKKKEQMLINLYEADISAYEEITDIDFKFHVFDVDTYETISEMEDPITVHFNEQ